MAGMSTTFQTQHRDGPTNPATRARQKAAEADREAAAIEDRLRTNSRLRVGAFLLMVGPLLLLETSPRATWPALLAVAGVGGVFFVLLVRRHRRLRRKAERERLRERLYHESLARMARDWAGAPLPSLGAAPANHPCATDLDLLGRGSLAQLLGRVNTGPGRAALRRSLLDPLAPLPSDAVQLLAEAEATTGPARTESAPPGQTEAPDAQEAEAWIRRIRRRQEAVDALARDPELLEELELAAREVSGEASAARTLAFLRWSGGGTWLSSHPGLLWAARGVAAFNLATLTIWFLGWVGPPIWVLGMVAAYVVNRMGVAEAHRRFAAAEGGEGDPARWAALLQVAQGLSDDDPTLAGIRRQAGAPPPGASGALQRLRSATDVAAVRYSGLVHFPLAVLVAWDIHALRKLERWQDRYGAHAEGWVLAVAELELLVALAGLRHEHPDWSFPCFTPPPVVRGDQDGNSASGATSDDPEGLDMEGRNLGGWGIRGEDLGHPLLPTETCVGNDVEVPGPGTLLLVTGSNMAGKTTLLRALGANQVLGLMGGVVAARSMETRPLLPWTAMRVQDSVQEGVSFFMAELQRLRRVVDAARRSPVLFLLDEILQGTNTAERRTAARIVLRHLLDTRAIGAVTTHDLTLADAPDLQKRSVDIHFREDVVEEDGRRKLHFDYRLRPGPATSRNALLLLELVGLSTGEHEEPDENA